MRWPWARRPKPAEPGERRGVGRGTGAGGAAGARAPAGPRSAGQRTEGTPASAERPAVGPDAAQRRAGPAPEATSAVTAQRLRQVVVDRGYHVRTGADESIAGMWDGYQFQLRLAGEKKDVLSVRGTWGRSVPEGLLGPVVQAVNDWNRDKVWPTVFTAPLEDGLTVRTEIMADVSAGATDRQLLDLIEGGLSSGVQFFQALGRSMPPIEEPSPEI